MLSWQASVPEQTCWSMDSPRVEMASYTDVWKKGAPTFEVSLHKLHKEPQFKMLFCVHSNCGSREVIHTEAGLTGLV